MSVAVRNRLLGLGVLWGLLLAALPVVVMARPYRLSGFLIAGLVCAVLSGGAGTLIAGRWATRRAGRGDGARSWILAGLGTGLFQGLFGGAFAAFMIWALMSVTLSGFTLWRPVELSELMSPRVFLGSFFVSLSVFLYALAGGVLLGPAFGTLVNRAVGGESS